MSLILLDQNAPFGLRTLLVGHDVKTAYEMGWDALSNGDLLKAAETAGFAVMVTCDQNIRYQQNMTDRKIGLVVLSTNNWNVIRSKSDLVQQSVNQLKPSGYDYVECGLAPKRRLPPPTLKL